ncbi:DsbA family protein [Corynebacterium renale]|uniref:Protein-disulfide isomerase n=1 Tax=Corynebacterium renale TaxID=1724 RepID=A0A2A9DND7_9CORY|nr:thioredoxin domain-containing protein [Corynebacterium renale]PFG28124.1 protein-disulfide isomerase [Corynebacterium renale]SQI20455.1 Thiol:disulfide interchange protein DsbA [Corynebacterium renale]
MVSFDIKRALAGIVGIALAGSLVACSADESGSSADSTAVTSSSAATSETSGANSTPELAAPELTATASVGQADAPVRVVKFADLRCPYCAVFSHDMMPVIQEYVDAGDARVDLYDVAILGKDSERASTALRAAGEQGKYTEFEKEAFSRFGMGEHPEWTVEELVDVATVAGVPDIALFESRIGAKDLQEAVEKDTKAAIAAGLQSVPTVFVGSAELESMDQAQLRDLIESELATLAK